MSQKKSHFTRASTENVWGKVVGKTTFKLTIYIKFGCKLTKAT